MRPRRSMVGSRGPPPTPRYCGAGAATAAAGGTLSGMATAIFDDIELVRLMDSWERDGRLQHSDGEQLMTALGGNSANDNERAAFTRLITVLAEDEVLAFDQPWAPMGVPPPQLGEYQYLQSIRKLRLLPKGIDRARGRIVIAPAPEVEADDGRRLPVRVVDKAAKEISERFTGSELPAFLSDSGIPDEHIPPFEGTKWRYVSETLQQLWAREAPGRRLVRRFLGAWLDDELEVAPDPKVREEILGDLLRQGWHLRGGELVVGAREKPPRPSAGSAGASAAAPRSPAADDVGSQIFLVHGTDRAARAEVARFVENITRRPVTILDERPNRGATLIEKYEREAAATTYAIALLTADDVGGRNLNSLASRARQNVIFELGYFFRALGRHNVAVLYEQGVEQPSDVHGLVYIPLDSGGGWRLQLARELRAAGFEVDVEKLL
jgi:predicted nucleotide-binding protein